VVVEIENGLSVAQNADLPQYQIPTREGRFQMKKSSAKQRIGQLKLDLLDQKEISVSFDGEDLSNSGGTLLLAQIEKLNGLIRGCAQRLDDHRTGSLVKHSQFDLVMQRVMQIVAGFPTGSDSTLLRNDPAIKIATGRDPLTGEELASQASQSRLETQRNFKELYRLCQWLVDYYIQCHPKPPKNLVLDFDGSAIETYGLQLQALYRSGPYGKFMYFPLFVFDQDGWLLVAALRPGDHGEVKLALPVLKRLVARLRKAWPAVKITIRADGAFTDAGFYKWMDDNNVRFVLGIKHNNTLLTHSLQARRAALKKFKRKFGATKFTASDGRHDKFEELKDIRTTTDAEERRQKSKTFYSRVVRVFGDFQYKAKSWDRERRIICRCDCDDEGLNVRYVVTNIQNFTAAQIYEDLYCKRARIELCIKNMKETQCHRLSCSQFKSNMFRLILHSLAYTLVHQARIALPKALKNMSFSSFCRRFVNVAVQIRESKKSVIVRISASYVDAHKFRLLAKRHGATSLIAA